MDPSVTPEMLREMLRQSKVFLRGRIRLEHPTDVDVLVICANRQGTKAGVVECIWGASERPNLHRGSVGHGLSHTIINLDDNRCLEKLSGFVDSLGRTHELWLLPDEVVWVVTSSDALLLVRDTARSASAFALQQLASFRTALATAQRASFHDLEPDWQSILTCLRQRLKGLHERSATERMNTVGP